MPPKTAADRRKAAKKAAAGPAEDNSKKSQGNQAYKERKFELAVDLYTQAIKENEKDANVHAIYANRSAAYAEQKKYAEALTDAQQVTKLQPNFSKGWYRMGVALSGLMRLNESAAAFNKALALDKEDAPSKAALAEVLELMNEMKLTQSEVVLQDNPEKDRFDVMCDWLRAGGAKFPLLYLQYYEDDYRGVHALGRIPNDNVVLDVPLPLIMTSEVAKDSDIGKKLIHCGVKLRSTHSYLASFLCQEKQKKQSFWSPYINILPQNYRNMPIFFEEAELRWLKGSFALKKIADRKEDLLAEYDNICKYLPELKQLCTVKEFVWARLAVITRIFGLVINGNKTDGLVPMADMLNHKRPRESSWTFDDKRNGFTITSLKALSRGDQVYDSYGRKCNSRFFVNYGFALEDNEDNQCVVPLEISAKDPQYAMKLRFLGGHHSSMRRRFQVPIQYKEKETKELFSFARFAFAKDSEIMLLGNAEDFKIDDIEPVSIDNEVQVLKAIAESSERMLQLFDHTLEDDNKLVKQDKEEKDPKKKLTMNFRNCLMMRRGEKEVLHFYIDMAKECIPLLQMPWKDLKRHAAKCYSGKGKFDQYITLVIVPLVKAGGGK